MVINKEFVEYTFKINNPESLSNGGEIISKLSGGRKFGDFKFKRKDWGGFWQVSNGHIIVFLKDGTVSITPHIHELFNNDWIVVDDVSAIYKETKA